jgi:hypothetical protein
LPQGISLCCVLFLSLFSIPCLLCTSAIDTCTRVLFGVGGRYWSSWTRSSGFFRIRTYIIPVVCPCSQKCAHAHARLDNKGCYSHRLASFAFSGRPQKARVQLARQNIKLSSTFAMGEKRLPAHQRNERRFFQKNNVYSLFLCDLPATTHRVVVD